jgi:tetratricopeptide (TPR) repeat protein
MFRHIALVICLTAAALAAGAAMVPGEREQWTMLVRDGRNKEALKTLQGLYDAGHREIDTVVNLYKLHMSFAEIDAATRVLADFVAAHPDNAETLALLAKHYADIEDKPDKVASLERLFELSPSPATARELLAQYRLDGAFDREQKLLKTLLANDMITANDAERLGLVLAAQGDLYGAREALMRFDEIANPERSLGRFVLFDVLVQTGDTAAALAKAASWIGYFRKANIHHSAAGETPTARLVRMMMSVDEAAAERLICQAQREEAPLMTPGVPDRICALASPGAEGALQAPSANAVTRVEPADEMTRARRR